MFCSKNKYDNKFDQFMKQHQDNITSEEKQKRAEAAKEEIEEQSRKAQEESKQAEQKLKDTKKAFEDFSAGKGEEELKLNFKAYKDEAFSMFKEVGQGATKRVSSILEMRKALFKKEKKEEVEKAINEEKQKVAQAAKDQTTEATDQTKEAKSGVEEGKDKTTEAEQTSEEQKAEEAEKEPEEDKPGKFAILRSKVTATRDRVGEKFPFVQKTGTFIKDIWQETFPSDDKNVKKRIEKRREIAKMQKQYTEEELDEMQEQIPEWKRTAVTTVDEDKVQGENSGLFKKFYKKVGTKISDTSIAKKIVESEEYKEFKKKYRDVKTEASTFKEDLKDEVESSHNPVVGSARSMGDYIFRDTSMGQAIGKMKEYDPEFDVMDLHYEVEEIFTDLFDNYLEGDLEYLEKFCGEAALAVIKTELKRREKEGWEPKIKELLFCSDPNLAHAGVGEDNRPKFTFTITGQEINCKVSKKNPEQVVEGSMNDLEKSVYKITLARHDEPDMALTGHYWEVVEFEKHEAVKQLV